MSQPTRANCKERCCERLGLVIAELVTNAAKHAFHGRDDGLVRVELINRINSWVCIVSDNGIGTVMAPLGVGSKILERLVGALDGTLSDGPDVVARRVSLPAKYRATHILPAAEEGARVKSRWRNFLRFRSATFVLRALRGRRIARAEATFAAPSMV